MIIGIDVDGVLRDFETQVRRVYKRVYPDHEVKPFTRWGLHNFFPIGKRIYDFIWHEYARECLEEAPMYLGVWGFLTLLRELGAEICIVTNQPTVEAKLATIHWLERNGIMEYADHLMILGNGLSKSDIKLDMLLDDATENLRDARDAGIRAVCLDRMWNRDWDGERVRDYWEFVELVKKVMEHGKK